MKNGNRQKAMPQRTKRRITGEVNETHKLNICLVCDKILNFPLHFIFFSFIFLLLLIILFLFFCLPLNTYEIKILPF